MPASARNPKVGLTQAVRRALEDARKVYVEGIPDDAYEFGVRFPTLEDLREQFDVPLTTLRRVSQAEDWRSQRDALRASAIAKQTQEILARRSRKSQEIDDRVIRLGEMGLTLVQRVFTEMTKQAQIALREEQHQHTEGVPVPYKASNISATKLVQTIRAWDQLHKTMRNAVGDPVPELLIGPSPTVLENHELAKQAAASVSPEAAAQDTPAEIVAQVTQLYVELEREAAHRIEQPVQLLPSLPGDPDVIQGEVVEDDIEPPAAANGHRKNGSRAGKIASPGSNGHPG